MNKDLTVKEILECTKGKLIIGKDNIVCSNFSKDTRTIKKDDTYIGIKGENFDGSLFWKEALKNGAKVAIVENIEFSEKELDDFKDKTIIKVENTLNALYEIATYKRNLYNIPIIGVTGSVGKTSTKDMIASVLSQKYNTLKTEGNNNNSIGLPLTILKLKDHEAAVIEMGMNHFGEISILTKIAKPTISVITNIGTSHIGNLGSRENILRAKLEILEGMDKKILVINNDNDLLNKWSKDQQNCEIHTYGIENISDLMAKNIKLHENSSDFECDIDNNKLDIHVPVAGEHFILNAMCATCIGKLLGLTDEEIKNGIKTFELTKRRMDITKSECGATIINDTYNASYESMKASIKSMCEYKNNRKIAVLGDMFELGKFSEELHEKVGEEVAKNNIDILLCCGENSKFIVKSAQEHRMNKENIYYLENKQEIINKLKQIIDKNDVILVKASNGMKFSEIVEELKNN